ncbi:MAG TPA: cyclopropane-fatty-acyl-phospholipid synthase family protein [Thermoanaerobaculia bacterium]|nr:cyclopropane-fatty-acyl-phospholipid synthase family protein [Thermoanaerobaculia bacterium]
MSLARDVFFRALSRIRDARLELRDPAGVRVFGDENAELRAIVEVRDPRLYGRVLRRGDLALGEGYTDGLWTSPDTFAAARVGVRNARAFEPGRFALAVPSAITRARMRRKHRRRTNSLSGSRRNIEAHYDLGNDFYSLFLDRRHMAYSCALFESPDASLEDAQEAKFERIARKLGLDASHHVLEIGTGWGGFAIWAASRYGCRVTTATISRAQHDFARRRIDRENLADRVTLLYEDYRRLSGSFDRIVSIEMFEAVGLPRYDEFFGTVERLLSPHGAMLLQTITMNEQCFPAYHKSADWIQLYVFPGAELASVSEVLRSIGRVSRLTLVNLEDIGLHYVRTLLSWRERFLDRVEAVRALGFDERFVRLWDYYLAACAAAFAERHIGDAQMLFVKHPSGDRLSGEPEHSDPVRAPRRAAAGS